MDEAFKRSAGTFSTLLLTGNPPANKDSLVWRELDLDDFVFLSSALAVPESYLDILLHFIDENRDGFVTKEELVDFARACTEHYTNEKIISNTGPQSINNICTSKRSGSEGLPLQRFRTIILSIQKELLRYVYALYSLGDDVGGTDNLSEAMFLRYIIGQHVCSEGKFDSLMKAWGLWCQKNTSGKVINFNDFQKIHNALLEHGAEILDVIRLFCRGKEEDVSEEILRRTLTIVGCLDRTLDDSLVQGIIFVFSEGRSCEKISYRQIQKLVERKASEQTGVAEKDKPNVLVTAYRYFTR